MAILSWKQFIRYLRLLFPLMFNYKVFGIFAFRGNFDFGTRLWRQSSRNGRKLVSVGNDYYSSCALEWVRNRRVSSKTDIAG